MAFQGGRAYLVPPQKLLVTFDVNPGKTRIECRRYTVHQAGAAVAQSDFRRGRIIGPGEALEFFVGRGRRQTRKTVINDSGAPVFRES
ncbi:MAG: hypothetical protein ACM3NH_01830 [Candidatus Saccharibacteria bacterium]